jgi:protoporphyrin/coproporphyrin ferrochelatase
VINSEKPNVGILLVNLGTPDSPRTSDVRSYLKEFLLDPRVVDIPTIPRNLLVRGIIAPFRAPKSAKTYKAIWSDDGSPLLVYSKRMKILLQEALGERYAVYLAMRYKNPSLSSILKEMEKEGFKRIRVIPLFPQYASATTGSVHQNVMEIVSRWQTVPNMELVNSYPDHPGLIETVAERASHFDLNNYDHYVFSFHGLPVRQLRKADFNNHCQKSPDCCKSIGPHNQMCYGAQCHLTAKKIADRLKLDPKSYTVSFQSRLGKTPWIQPYSSEVLEKLAKNGKKRILFFSPAFVADCLETIFEIGEEYKEDFLHLGGEQLVLVPSLNDHPKWIETLVDLSTKSLP